MTSEMATVGHWPVRVYQRLEGSLASATMRRLTVWLMKWVLLLRALAPGNLLQRAVLAWVRMEAAW